MWYALFGSRFFFRFYEAESFRHPNFIEWFSVFAAPIYQRTFTALLRAKAFALICRHGSSFLLGWIIYGLIWIIYNLKIYLNW